MSPNINMTLIGGMMLIMLPVGLSAQEQSREQILAEDISRLGERAVRDKIIDEKEYVEMIGFVRDSLPEGTDLKIRALEQIRDELDEQYAEMVSNSMKLFDEAGYIGSEMLPELLYEPDEYISPEERRRKIEAMATANVSIDIEELMKHVKPLEMPSWL